MFGHNVRMQHLVKDYYDSMSADLDKEENVWTQCKNATSCKRLLRFNVTL